MVVAVIAGILTAIVGLLPISFAIKKARRIIGADTTSLLGRFALAIVLSFVILAAGLIICSKVAHDVVIAYALAEIFLFVIGVIVVGVVMPKVNNKEEKE